MKKLLAMLVVAAAPLALPVNAWAVAQCGLPSTTPWWIDFGHPDLADTFGRQGLILGVSTGDFPAAMREKGAHTIYWDMNLNRRVGTPSAPADPSLIEARANSLFNFAAQQSGCDKPLIVLNELFGATLETPWSATNQQYRDNVLALMRVLAARGARPFLLISSEPYTASDEAAAWWREAAKYGDLVPEVYFNANNIWKVGPVVGSRRIRVAFRREIANFTAIGIPTSKLGLVLGFQTGRGAGGREGLQPDRRWYEVVKWQALAARQIAGEMKIASVVSWGWGSYTQSADNGDKRITACVYLWARNPGAGLCDGPATAGPQFNASLREGQIRLSSGAQCQVNGTRSISSGAVAAVQRLTGDRAVALTVLLARMSEAPYLPIPAARVLAAERAVIALRFNGSRAAYLGALRRANGSVTIARGVLADELRRLELSKTMRARRASSSEVSTFYYSYPDLTVRSIEAKPAKRKPAPWWLGSRTEGLAIIGLAPERVFSLPEGVKTKVVALDGTYEVTARGEAQPLGAVPLELARASISAALRAFTRRAAFEQWSLGRQNYFLAQTICRKDDVPEPGSVRLTSYLPFLSLDGA
jgi:hypothetical protein